MVKYAHTNIIADDWEKLAEFYIKVFDCKPLYPTRDLSGDWIDKATGISDAHFKGIHLCLPGFESNLPTLEIFQYDTNVDVSLPVPNRKGFGHICFRVDDVKHYLNLVIENGGSTVGEMAEHEIEGVGLLCFVYARDVEGNIVEIQSWK
ncbi:MAG: glyoxalase [Bacteroidetes bacterium]|nr:MAG: glyoxalase [Bacteroidota bacterium]